MLETLKRWYYKIRITLLKIFTNRVKEISITDEKGRRHKVTAEQTVENVCDHKVMRQVHHILWKCNNPACEMDAYWFIPSKIFVAKPELYVFLDDVANHLGEELHEKGTVITNDEPHRND